MRVKLRLIEGPEVGKVFEFSEPDSFLVGRSPKAHLRFDGTADRHISRTHCLLDIRPPRCILRDLESTNGTRVNGKRIRERDLENGDEIQVGKTRIEARIQQENGPVLPGAVCSRCGRDVNEEVRRLHPNGPAQGPYVCEACQKRERIKAQRRKVEKPPGVLKSGPRFSCAGCGKDLSESANSDGRAADLRDSPYLCQPCALKEQAMGLDFEALGDYTLLNELGRGGMGIVYRAVHRPTRRVCAVKRIISDYVRNERACRLFEREIAIQSEVQSPNLVSLIGQGRAGITPFFASEYMAGGDVAGLVTQVFKGPVDPHLACLLTIQILTGLQALHEMGFIHRDLKPANYLLSGPHNHKGLVVKISDYGLAKSFEDAGNSLFDYTKTGQYGGSLMFMAPEQIVNYRFIKPPSDVYSVGVSLYYMLSSKYTVEFPTPLEILRGALANRKPKNPVEVILEAPPIPLSQRRPDLPRSLAAVVDKAVDKDSDKRFQSARELKEALEDIALP
jgi:hypothetical protein